MCVKSKSYMLFIILYISVPNISYSANKECLTVFTAGEEISAREDIAQKVSETDRISFIKKYKDQEGYIKFVSELKRAESMDYVWHEVSRILGKSEMKRLGWQIIHGTLKEFNDLKYNILEDDYNLLIDLFSGMDGYALFAIEKYSGNMQKTFMNVSALLGRSEMKRTGWQQFHGTAEEYYKQKQEILNYLLNKDGSINDVYQNMDGYALFAKKYYSGDMEKTFINVSAILSESEMKRTGWQQFQGTAEEYYKQKQEILNYLLNKDGSIKDVYQNMDGYALFAKKYYSGNMQKAFTNVSAILSESEMKRTGWQQFQGTAEEFEDLKYNTLQGDYNLLKDDYSDMDGCVRFAEEWYSGNMQKAFKNVSAMLGGAQAMKELGVEWIQFQGTTAQFKSLKALFNKHKSDLTELQGVKGQEKVAREIFKGNTRTAYRNVSVLREELLGSWDAFKELNWERIQKK